MSQFPVVDDEFVSRLFEASFVGRHQQLASLFDVNFLVDGRTLLHIAIEREDIHMIVSLLRFGADPNLRSGHTSITPLGRALNLGRADLIQVLIAFGARFDYSKSALEDCTIETEVLSGDYPHRMKLLFGQDEKVEYLQ
jgi:ankyrin repeat protein